MEDKSSTFDLTVNGQPVSVSAAADTPLLWVLRDNLDLIGTKYGCGIGLCGSCTVLIDGVARKACKITVSRSKGRDVRTIEGIDPDARHPLQRAWIEEDVPQCGYCQAGQIMTALSLLERNPHPNDDEIWDAMSPVLCRCGTYQRIHRAVRRASNYMAEEKETS